MTDRRLQQRILMSEFWWPRPGRGSSRRWFAGVDKTTGRNLALNAESIYFPLSLPVNSWNFLMFEFSLRFSGRDVRLQARTSTIASCRQRDSDTSANERSNDGTDVISAMAVIVTEGATCTDVPNM